MEGVSREQVKDFIKNMTLMDAAALVKELEEELGVSAAAPVARRLLAKYFGVDVEPRPGEPGFSRASARTAAAPPATSAGVTE